LHAGWHWILFKQFIVWRKWLANLAWHDRFVDCEEWDLVSAGWEDSLVEVLRVALRRSG